jgi:acetyltransferase-like isoleucine patch superfamily enzyme
MKDVTVHPSAIIYPGAQIGANSQLEPFSIVGIADRFHDANPCIIGAESFVGSRSTIYSGVIAGDRFDVSDQTTVFFDNEFGSNCRVGPKAVVKNGCRFGDNVRVNAQAFLERVVVGSNVFIGPGTVFTDDLHPPCPKYSDCVPKTIVESWVSIGANVTVGPGIKIGHHTQVYAGSVVIDDIAPYSVVAGNPARVVKDFRELECRGGFYKRPFDWWADE